MGNPSVLTQPESVNQLTRGFNHLGELLACTLGPTRGVVLYKEALRSDMEVITDAATIARRVTSLGDAGQDVGAMLLRNLVWRVRQRAGDGGATTAVLAMAILNQAVRFTAAGANPAALLRGLRIAAAEAVKALVAQSFPASDEEDLEAVARSVTREPELSFVLAEIFSLLGASGHVQIEEFVAPYLDREYIDGGRWRASLASAYLINMPATRSLGLDHCRVALYDGVLSRAEEVLPLLEVAAKFNPPHLLLVAQKINEQALNLIVANHVHSNLKIAAAALEGAGETAFNDLHDLGILTGAAVVSPQVGESLSTIKPNAVGGARRVEATQNALIVSGGMGEPDSIRAEIETLQRVQAQLGLNDGKRSEFQMRVGRLAGSMAVLKVGAHTNSERAALKQKAEQGIKALQTGLDSGLLPGGGTAYLRCIPAVAQLLKQGAPTEEDSLGIKVLMAALEAPFRRILENARIASPGVSLNDCLLGDPNDVFDVLSGEVRPARQSGILDPAGVLIAALETAVSGASMALSTETLILKRNPKIAYEP